MKQSQIHLVLIETPSINKAMKKVKKTKIGKIAIEERGGLIVGLRMRTEESSDKGDSPLLDEAFRQLEEYLDGKRKVFDLPLALIGTEFQKKVWQALQNVPYGKTASYKDIAEMVGCPNGARAVGMANRNNPIPIIFPCHRIIAADGSIGGFSDGTEMKLKIMRAEGISLF